VRQRVNLHRFRRATRSADLVCHCWKRGDTAARDQASRAFARKTLAAQWQRGHQHVQFIDHIVDE
jgi:hypothetical protein